MGKGLGAAAMAAALAFGLAACDRPKPGEPEEMPDPIPGEDAAPAEVAPAGSDADAAAADADFEKRAAENLAKADKFLADNGARNGVTTTASGLQYEILSEGPADGYAPTPDDIVDVHYVGTLTDGIEFDSSRARNAAARFQLGQVIDGWIEGLQLMSEGDRYRFFIPPELAYGDTGTPGGPIGPNEALIFDVELLKVTNAERNLAAAEAFLAANAAKEGVKSTASGLQYQVLAEGPADGKSPSDANIVVVNYEGTLTTGAKFDSSYDRGQPAEFPLGQVIPGWVEGVQLMSVGDKYRFFIPPQLAYGPTGTPGGPIGPNEALVFDVELLEVKE